MERDVFIREQKNGWYSTVSYFIGRNLAEGLVILGLSAFFAGTEGLMSQQTWSATQYLGISLLHGTVGLITMAQSLTISIVFMGNVTASVFGGAAFLSPFIAVNAMLVYRDPDNDTWINHLAQKISYMYYGFIGTIKLSFEGRCDVQDICGMADRDQPWVDTFVENFEHLAVDDDGKPPEKNFIIEFVSMLEEKFGHISREACDPLTLRLRDGWSESRVIDRYDLREWTFAQSMGILTLVTLSWFIVSFFVFKYRFKFTNV